MTTTKEPLSLEFFTGGVPAGALFQLNASELEKVLNNAPEGRSGQALEEVCFIGLVSYFEAFSHDCFASLINLCPDLLMRLKSRKYDIQIDPVAAIEMGDVFAYNVGFLVCERFDFGGARKINALYSSLVGVTPFAKDEIPVYDRILADRNLVVHHGGIYTRSYLRQRLGADSQRPFMDSLKIDASYVRECFDFLYAVAQKVVRACDQAVNRDIERGEIAIAEAAMPGLRMFGWWD